MAKNKTSDPSETVSKSGGSVQENLPERNDWDRKLSEARAKRAEVLSARAQAQSSQDINVEEKIPGTKVKARPKKSRAPKRAGTGPVTQEGPVLETPTAEISEAARVKFSLSGANALKALFVFCGAVGFGIGTVIGFAILMGMGASPSPQNQLVFDAAEIEDSGDMPVQAELPVQSETLLDAEAPAPETAETTVSLEADEPVAVPVEIFSDDETKFDLLISPEDLNMAQSEAEAVVPQPEEPAVEVLSSEIVPALPDMLDKDFGFFTEPDGEANLPNISNVRYMRDDVPEMDAVYLRSLPEVEELNLADAPVIETGDPKPKFFMHAPDGLSDAQIRRFVAQLAEKGVEVSKIGREGFRVSTTHLRYYSPDNAEVARTVADDLGIPARDFSENAQNPGRIEVWMAGGPKPVEAEEETSKGVFYWLGQGRREER